MRKTTFNRLISTKRTLKKKQKKKKTTLPIVYREPIIMPVTLNVPLEPYRFSLERFAKIA